MTTRPERIRGVTLIAAAASVVLAAGCAGRAPVPLRPEPRPFADTVPVAEPKARGGGQTDELWELTTEGFSQGFAFRKWTGEQHPAVNVTRFDDVVGSSWFRHRNDRDRLSPERLALGPDTTRPDMSRGLTIVDAKTAGVTPGFTIEDARGQRYLLKLDPEGHLHLSTSAEMITSRLFWGAGYNVPETLLLRFRPEDLRIGDEATMITSGGSRPMTREDLRRLLSKTERLPDGRYLAVCSRFVEGTPKGPWYFRGTRDDDPNDYYRHEHRREIRGLFVLSAWLNHVDTRFANTLSSYVEPGYLRHYLIDFGSSLGSAGVRPHSPRDGAEYNIDLVNATWRLLTLGFWREGWEGEEFSVIHPSIGWLPVQSFRPGEWKPNWPNEAHHSMTPADGYWGAKLVGSFTDAQIRAVVEAGGLPAEAATDTLTEILRYRRDRVVEHWYGEVTPVEELAVDRSPGGSGGELRLSFRDLGLAGGPWSAEETTYRWRLRHPELGLEAVGEAGGRAGTARQSISVSPDGPAELPAAGELSGEGRLARLELRALRPDARGRPAVVWLRWHGPEEGYRLAGLRH